MREKLFIFLLKQLKGENNKYSKKYFYYFNNYFQLKNLQSIKALACITH